ncbi:MAG: cyclic 2,3-diphosphoglycerate synthase [Candidatus Bipolaricaulis anaerobius]|nr:GTPase [Candidatus Bipolaricaulis sp.]MDD5764371.1 cyclic 2,3-diphosphoglycerate synthase [Candidatus Bipolaricaulis anaerobius]HOD73619.1 cyclic 2,3-diphosphoglycerate synthase [Candidatus Bipolaricaulis anaerobius]HQM38436.1 cyclic 2,3-diphosphoglycerate synthase [Candidatus Bipolaricaulis anaerobius]
MSKTKVIIMGAAGRDFHNFNVVFRDNDAYEVVAFTATQIPGIVGRRYPAELAGRLYPNGIPIEPEERLPHLVREKNVDRVVFAYSDVSHQHVMERAALAAAAGADFWLLSPRSTQLVAKKPVVAVCAVRTGAGKSQTTRRVAQILHEQGKRVAVVRHPMPYGDLVRQKVQRFASFEDLDRAECTIEEREEYEPHIQEGFVVYAGVDYGAILRQAEAEADVILWDGGNNDFPFFRPDFLIVVADPLRVGHENTYWPGSVLVRQAAVIVINKVDTAGIEPVERLRASLSSLNPRAKVVEAASPITLDAPELVAGRRVLVIEDGPTVTHGEMPFGAGAVAARKLGATFADPRPHAQGSLGDVYKAYPHLGPVLPAMGYGKKQIEELAQTIARVPCDAVVIATPVDLRRLIAIEKPSTRVRYDLQEIGRPTVADLLPRF